jgi:hypothetical protein
MTSHSSIESRARVLARKVDQTQLLKQARLLQKQGLPSAAVFYRALRVADEDRSLHASLTATDLMGDAVYWLRPNGPLPSDGVSL